MSYLHPLYGGKYDITGVWGRACDNARSVDPSRKRNIRLGGALRVAVLLAVGLVYTSFSASTEAKEPSQLLSAAPGKSYEMTGEVVPGSARHPGTHLRFRAADRSGGASVPVTYSGTVPAPSRGGREIGLKGEMRDGTFIGQPDTLVTK